MVRRIKIIDIMQHCGPNQIKIFKCAGTGVTVNAVHPGLVETEITRHMSFFNSYISSIILKPLIWMFIKNPVQGAQTTIYAALEPVLEKVSGKYFSYVLDTMLSLFVFNLHFV